MDDKPTYPWTDNPPPSDWENRDQVAMFGAKFVMGLLESKGALDILTPEQLDAALRKPGGVE